MLVLDVKNVKKVYGSKVSGSLSTALNGVSLQIEQGEFVGIMGPSGAGKSTLLNIIATIDSVTSGKIYIGGKNISQLKESELSTFRRNQLGFIFQDYNLLDTLTLRENIALPLILSKVNDTQIDEIIEKTSRTLGINNILEKYPYEVSGGQNQRAAAARAIINNPALILADEPTGALDSISSKELLQYMRDLNDDYQATILLVTHDAFAASYCKRILFIRDGVLYTELYNPGDRKEFFDMILKVLSAMGGDNNELF